jgi:hypothetical protein
LVSKGWDAALAELSPDRKPKPGNPLTVGDMIETVRAISSVRPRMFEIYAYALRRIARESIGLKDAGKKKFDPKSHKRPGNSR